jgi:hypothetical protein
MIRNYKAFGLALVAMLALGAFVAQGATAAPLTVEGITGPATVFTTGDQDGGTHVFTSGGGSVSCVEASFAGSGAVDSSGKVNEQTVTGTYPTEKAGGGNNCTAFGFAGAHIKTNECTYTFTTPTSVVAGKEVKWSKEQLHLVCPTGKSIEITPTFLGSSVCTQFIGSQTPTGGHVIGKNVTGSSPMDITLEITLKEIHYTGTGSSCGNSETHMDGTLTGNSTVKCLKAVGGAQVGCTFS